MVLVEEPDSSAAAAVSDPRSLDALLPRLNRRGVREAGLHAALVASLPHIAGSLSPQPPPLVPSSISRRAAPRCVKPVRFLWLKAHGAPPLVSLSTSRHVFDRYVSAKLLDENDACATFPLFWRSVMQVLPPSAGVTNRWYIVQLVYIIYPIP